MIISINYIYKQMEDFIKKFWDNQAKKHGTSAAASWDDENAVQLEIDTIAKYIKSGDTVLDVGCANGHATIRQLEKSIFSNFNGVDYSQDMIDKANELRNKLSGLQKEYIKFSVADIKELPFENEVFDYTYTTRVLINLPNWEDQMKGIDECIRVTKKGGTIVLSEAFYEPLVLLNSLRQLKQLPLLVEHDFNRYLKKDRLEKMLEKYSLEYICDDFSSVYYLGSRFLRELVTKIEDYPGYSNPINKIFYDLENQFSGGGFGIQQAYVIKK